MRHARNDNLLHPLKRCGWMMTMASLALVVTPLAPAHAWQAAEPDAATRSALDRRTDARTLLSSALQRIAANESDPKALLDAGRASIDLEDYHAALSFLVRAEQVAPRDGEVKAALGSTMVRMEKPDRALDYFGEAQLNGAAERLFLSDRGLARDLMGQQDAAQRDYQLALSLAPNAETTRRYAISLGISGQVDEAINLLVPQLRTKSRAAWRTRAMILAMNGRDDEAEKIVRATMPPELASSLIPYLGRMDRLSAPQQAAAAHFGRFPTGPLPPIRASTQVAAASPPPPPPTAQKRPARIKRASGPAAAAEEATTAPPVAAIAVRRAEALPSPAAATVSVKTAPVSDAAIQGPPDTTVAPGFSIASAPSSSTIPSQSTSSTAETPTSLADIAGSLEIPAEELARTKGAVDAATLTKLQEDKRRAVAAEDAKREKEAAAAKAKAEEEAAAKALAEKRKDNPARDWVQIATGSNAKALAFDYRRFSKQHPDNFKGQDGGTAIWGQTRRLLVGPFKSRKEAQAWLSDYKKAGGDAFLFSSDAGETVDPIK